MKISILCLLITVAIAQEDGFEDELSAPPVGDFLPSAAPPSSTLQPTPPSLPQPVDAVPADEFRDVEEADVEVAEEIEVAEEEEVKVIEEPKEVKRPQKVNRLRTKPVEAKKPEIKKPIVPIDVAATFNEAQCDSTLYDCQGCAWPKHARNCKVKYFKDHGSIKTCEENGEISQHILDQCPLPDQTEEGAAGDQIKE